MQDPRAHAADAAPPASTYIVLALLTLVGAGLRLYGLGDKSLWNDELSAWSIYSNPTWHNVLISIPRFHGPAFWLSMHGWVGWVGDSEAMLRLPSALAGIAAIPAMFGLGRRLYGEREGLVAAALTAFAYLSILFSQEARPYMALFLFVVLSSNFLIDVVQALRIGAPLPRRAAVGYIACAVAACYLHYYGLFFVALQGLTAAGLCVRWPGAVRRLAPLGIAVLAAYLPWFRQATSHLQSSPEWLRAPDAEAAWRFARILFNESTLLTVVVLSLGALALARAAMALRRRGVAALMGSDALLLAWVVVPIAIVVVRSVLIAPSISLRSLIILIPAIYLLVARALTQLPLPPRGVTAVSILIPLLLLLHLTLGRRYYAEPGQEQFREAVEHVVRDDTGQPALILACAWNRAYFDYYFARLGSRRRVDRLAEHLEDRQAIGELIAARGPQTVWLLAGHKVPEPALLAWLGQELTLTDSAQLRGAAVWRFEPRR